VEEKKKVIKKRKKQREERRVIVDSEDVYRGKGSMLLYPKSEKIVLLIKGKRGGWVGQFGGIPNRREK